MMPTDFKLLSTPNIWIADAGATIHNTPHDIGMADVNQGTSKDVIAVGNGERTQSESMGSIKGVVTTKNGSTVATVTLKDVSCTPKLKFNLLSVTKNDKRWMDRQS